MTWRNHNVSDFEGFVGANNTSGPHVDIHTTGKVDTGSGFANIKPTNNRTSLTQLIFTPENGNLFSGFSFRGQLDHDFARTVTVMVQDNQGHAPQTFTFTNLGNGDFERQGIISLDGETIKSVTLNGHFKEVKQIDVDLCPRSQIGSGRWHDGNVAGRGPRLARYGATLPEEVNSLKQFSDTRVAVPFGAATFFVLLTKRAKPLPTASPSAGEIPSFPAMLLSGALRAESLWRCDGVG